jgi:hypothetical protein
MSGERNGRRQKNGDQSNFVNANHSFFTFWFDGSKVSVFLMESLTAGGEFCEMPAMLGLGFGS